MRKAFEFNLREVAGAIGDYGTIFPIVLGMVTVTDLDLSVVFFFFAISYIFTGVYYRLPIPVEPMKAIGVVAIAGELSKAEIIGSGIIMGFILLFISVTGAIDLFKKIIPLKIVRGIQLGLAFTLMFESISFLTEDILIGIISLIIVVGFIILPVVDISAIVIIVFGLIIGIQMHGFPELELFTIPTPMLPSVNDLKNGFILGAIPQIPLTVGNAVFATSLLVQDLFKKEVSEKKLLNSMGLMCLISTPFGGIPMCHGAGGLAAQYRFGARTGGSNIISGMILLFVALFFGSQDLINILPIGALGILLLFSGVELCKSAFKTSHYIFVIVTGIIVLLYNIAVALVVMVIVHIILSKTNIFQGFTNIKR